MDVMLILGQDDSNEGNHRFIKTGAPVGASKENKGVVEGPRMKRRTHKSLHDSTAFAASQPPT